MSTHSQQSRAENQNYPNYKNIRHAYRHSQHTVLACHAHALHAFSWPYHLQTADHMSDTQASLIP